MALTYVELEFCGFELNIFLKKFCSMPHILCGKNVIHYERGIYAAVKKLVKTYNKIYRYCFYRVRNSEVAEDITQETFLKFFGHKQRIRRGEDMAYLYTIAKNLCFDHFRQKQTTGLTEEYPAEDFAEQSDTKIAVQNALEKLDERHREIIVLRQPLKTPFFTIYGGIKWLYKAISADIL